MDYVNLKKIEIDIKWKRRIWL